LQHILDSYSIATRMELNIQKSTIFFSRIKEDDEDKLVRMIFKKDLNIWDTILNQIGVANESRVGS